ncbi:phosphatidylglycerophosphatase and protein-tyrosine phosphatase 1-like [Styela clava]
MFPNSIGPRLAFYPTLLYNVILEKITSRRWFDRIDETVLVGALPFKSMSRELVKKENVRGVISLNEEYELKRWFVTAKEWKELAVDVLYLPTIDLIAAPSQNNLTKGVEFIHKHAQRNESVYVHCKAGRTRSATLAACYLMTKYRWNPQKAIALLTLKRSHIWLRNEQLDAINCYHNANILQSTDL